MKTLVMIVFGLAVAGLIGAICAYVEPATLPQLPRIDQAAPVSYRDQVQPIFESRCVVCHGCYDAPCQLQLSSYAGVDRGASKQPVYDGDRLIETSPSRLFVDAEDTSAWRERGFSSVLADADRPGDAGLLLEMLALGRAHPFVPDARLPESVSLDIYRPLTCPVGAEFDSYAAQQPHGGMPYGMASLTDQEIGLIAAWVEQGARAPEPLPALPKELESEVERWEEFLNGDDLKARITARYLYEHWFLAHLYFDDHETGPFFRLVRSVTAPGHPIREIATRRPYDDPGSAPFWYRLERVETAILHKTHIVYALSDVRMRRLTELFLDSEWQPTRLPGYEADEASNPFVSFDQIPARSRYQFLLDDAEYFVMSFIRGPVCRGQIAVDVIEDHFFVTFLDPDFDPSIIDPTYLARTKELLRLPAEHESGYALGGLWLSHNLNQKRYLDVRDEYYDALDSEKRGPSLDFIWDGDGHNSNALLTVFRNDDNAMVVRGFLGAWPETGWVIDFPIFERIYYNLVAGFDVFGNVSHQLSTRLYMDHLRMQSEINFLTLLPADQREAIRASWYEGATLQLEYFLANRIRSDDHATRIEYGPGDVTKQLFEMILTRNAAVSGAPDLLNRCESLPCDRAGATTVERRAERALAPLAGVRGPWVATLPELAILRVRGDGEEPDAVYTLVHNRAHSNVAFILGNDLRHEPQRDTLTIAPGIVGSYPNFMFDVEAGEVDAFANRLASLKNADDLESLVVRWGVRRSGRDFWQSMDWLRDEFRELDPTGAGILDLARYQNL